MSEIRTSDLPSLDKVRAELALHPKWTHGQKAACAAMYWDELRIDVQRWSIRQTVLQGKPTRYSDMAAQLVSEAVGVSRTLIWEAYRVMMDRPVEFEKIKSGAVAVHTAFAGVQPRTYLPRASRQRTKVVTTSTGSRAERIEAVRGLSAEGYRREQIAEILGLHPDTIYSLAKDGGITLIDAEIRLHKRIDLNKVAEQTVLGAQALTAGLEMINGREDEIDASRAAEWALSLKESLSVLSRLMRQLQRRRERNGK